MGQRINHSSGRKLVEQNWSILFHQPHPKRLPLTDLS